MSVYVILQSYPFKIGQHLQIEFRWDIVDIEGQACQVRMSTRTIWSVRFHMFMSLVNSLATKGAEKYADNMIKGENACNFDSIFNCI